MDKHNLLELWKSQILMLRDHGKELQENSQLKLDWIEKTKLVLRGIEEINSCDRSWIDDEYGKWAKKEIRPLTVEEKELLKKLH